MTRSYINSIAADLGQTCLSSAVSAAALVAALAGLVRQATPAAAAVPLGHYCSKYDGVAVRVEPDGTARDNLAKDQTFQVQRSGDRWVYGYKIVNGVHGYVLIPSLYPC